MTRPPESGRGGGPELRLSDAERDRLAELLSRHSAEGRLSVAELEARLEVLYRAESRQQAAAALDGLPPLAPAAASAPRGRGRGHGEAQRPDPGWVATQERFRDPTSRRIMRVWVDPATGERHYVPDQPS